MSREYRKYEFCKSVGCYYYYPNNRFEAENCSVPNMSICPYTAKEFHKWLKENGFKIFKAESTDEVVMPMTIKIR